MNLLVLITVPKRIGLAWCDTAVGVVLPYGVIQTSDFRLQTSELFDLMKRED